MSSRSAANSRFGTGGFPVGVEKPLFSGAGKAPERIENARFIDGTGAEMAKKCTFAVFFAVLREGTAGVADQRPRFPVAPI
jgi:hypothetical protein